MPSNMPDARAINEALRRAREMQNRSAAPQEPEPTAVSLPEPQENTVEPQISSPGQPMYSAARNNSPLDLLLQDKERTLLLVLLLLLSSEPNNAELLFVLMYLML